MQIIPQKVKKILVFRNDRFGEFLLNIPALRALKRSFINAKLIAAVDPCVKELAECVPYIDEIIEWSKEKHSLKEKINLIRLLSKSNIDMAVMLNPSKEFNIITYLACIPVRVGYRRKWDFLLTHKIEDKKYLGNKHEIEYNLELVGLVGVKLEDNALALNIDNNVVNGLFKEYNIKSDENILAMHPFTSDPIKQWPLENFYKLAQKLSRELNFKIIVVGRPENPAKGFAMFPGINNVVDLTGKTTLRQLAGVLKKCRLLISCDSGPAHLASAVGRPVVSIFRNDIAAKSPLRWGPLSEGSIVIQKNSLPDITVEEVFVKVKSGLDSQNLCVTR